MLFLELGNSEQARHCLETDYPRYFWFLKNLFGIYFFDYGNLIWFFFWIEILEIGYFWFFCIGNFWGGELGLEDCELWVWMVWGFWDGKVWVVNVIFVGNLNFWKLRRVNLLLLDISYYCDIVIYVYGICFKGFSLWVDLKRKGVKWFILSFLRSKQHWLGVKTFCFFCLDFFYRKAWGFSNYEVGICETVWDLGNRWVDWSSE